MAKTKQSELNVDFIGGQDPLTPEEQLAISAFFKKQKQKKPAVKSPTRTKPKKPVNA